MQAGLDCAAAISHATAAMDRTNGYFPGSVIGKLLGAAGGILRYRKLESPPAWVLALLARGERLGQAGLPWGEVAKAEGPERMWELLESFDA